MKKYLSLIFTAAVIFFWSCRPEEKPPINEGDLSDIPYNPVPRQIKRLQEFPEMEIPEDNPLTEDGVQLGRMLFFDPILSSDSSMSCASCHLPEGAFTDNLRVSRGVTGNTGRRSSMGIMNIGYSKELFWDGRSASLEEQALLPVQDPVELHEDWGNVEEKLRRHSEYPARFRKAFGIANKSQITRDLAVKAISQFERTMIVGENSRFYKVFVLQEDFPSDEELNGYLMFFDASNGSLPDAQCFHCHTRPLFTDNDYRNNGIEEVSSLDDFPDEGRGEVTGQRFDNGKFKTPTLWNIAKTAPYMHDGRFSTLEEVLDHYVSGGHYADNLDPLISDIHLNEEEKTNIIIFLQMLTDTTFMNNPDFQDPFN